MKICETDIFGQKIIKKTATICLVFLLSMSITGCGDDEKPATSNADKTTAQAEDKSSKEFDQYVKFKRINIKNEKQRKVLLDKYNERKELAAAIEKAGLLDNEAINTELQEFKKEMLISRYFEKFLEDKVSDQAVLNYYNSHSADYEQKKIHVAHILLRTNPKMTETERKAKLTTAQEAYSKVSSGADFAQTAEEYSEDKHSKKNGGDLGWIKEGSIDKRFSNIVFNKLKEGEISQPFETNFGFHIVKVIKAASVVKKPFKAVSGDIRYQLRNMAKKAELERLLGRKSVVSTTEPEKTPAAQTPVAQTPEANKQESK